MEVRADFRGVLFSKTNKLETLRVLRVNRNPPNMKIHASLKNWMRGRCENLGAIRNNGHRTFRRTVFAVGFCDQSQLPRPVFPRARLGVTSGDRPSENEWIFPYQNHKLSTKSVRFRNKISSFVWDLECKKQMKVSKAFIQVKKRAREFHFL